MIPGVFASAAFRDQVPSDPFVVLLMRFDGNAIDEKGHTFTEVGTVTYSSGLFGQCMSLSVGDSGVSQPSATASLDLSEDFTIEGWFKPADTLPNDGCALISRFDTTLAAGWQIYLWPNGQCSFYSRHTNNGVYAIPQAGPDLRDGEWHHIAIVRLGGDIRMYVDGVARGVIGRESRPYNNSTARLSIGYQVQGNARYPFRGKVDEVRITRAARYTSDFPVPDKPFPSP